MGKSTRDTTGYRRYHARRRRDQGLPPKPGDEELLATAPTPRPAPVKTRIVVGDHALASDRDELIASWTSSVHGTYALSRRSVDVAPSIITHAYALSRGALESVLVSPRELEAFVTELRRDVDLGERVIGHRVPLRRGDPVSHWLRHETTLMVHHGFMGVLSVFNLAQDAEADRRPILRAMALPASVRGPVAEALETLPEYPGPRPR